MNKEHVLLLLIGRTASGKDTLAQQLCERLNLKQLISYTTRARRIDEGDTHTFVSEETYQTMLTQQQVAVDTNITGNYYWSTIDQLYNTDVYVVDYIGFKKLRELNLPNLRLVSVFINVPDDIRKDRALSYRKDDKAKFHIRNYAEAEQFKDMLKKADFDYAISNIDFAKAYSTLRWISTVEGIWKNNTENGKLKGE